MSTNEKPSAKPSFKPRQSFGPSFEDRPHDPRRTIDKADITNLFTIVQDGANYDKLRNFISERNNTYKLQNENGETVIHMMKI